MYVADVLASSHEQSPQGVAETATDGPRLAGLAALDLPSTITSPTPVRHPFPHHLLCAPVLIITVVTCGVRGCIIFPSSCASAVVASGVLFTEA